MVIPEVENMIKLKARHVDQMYTLVSAGVSRQKGNCKKSESQKGRKHVCSIFFDT